MENKGGKGSQGDETDTECLGGGEWGRIKGVGELKWEGSAAE